MALWLEFENGSTKEAVLIRDFDRFECLVQTFEYERTQGLKSLQDFRSQADRIRSPEVKQWAEHQLQEWEKFWSRQSNNIIVIFVLGGPGVGKGTQCTKLAQDLLREERVHSDSPFSDFINESIKESVIIPAQLTVGLLERRIRLCLERGQKRFLIDGFPRSLQQILAFEEQVQQENATLFLDCSEEASMERLENRASTSVRIDDNEDSIRKRLKTFRDENEPILEHLRRGGPVKTVECNASADEVYESTIINQMGGK